MPRRWADREFQLAFFKNLGALFILFFIPVPSAGASEPARAAREGAYGEWITASIVRSGSDTLVVLNPGSSQPETLAIARLGIVEVEAGRHPSGKNMVLGLAAGIIVGAVAGVSIAAAGDDCQGDLCGLGGIGGLWIGAAVGGGLGVAVGAIPVRSWDRIHTSPDARRWLHSRQWPYTGS